MLKVFILACCLAAASYGDPNAQFGGYPVSYPFSFHQLKPNHHQILPSIKNIDSSQVNKRTFWPNYYNYFGVPTITAYTVSTYTFTCTKSTSSTCAGRRRREVLDGMLSSADQTQQFPEISPSKVAAIEPTVSIESVRETRKADPQFYYQQQPLRVNPYFTYQQQPMMNGYLSAAQMLTGAANIHPGTSVVGDSFFGDDRSDLDGTFRSFYRRPWVTYTSVVVLVTTSTSTPTCSTAGTLPQCAQSG